MNQTIQIPIKWLFGKGNICIAGDNKKITNEAVAIDLSSQIYCNLNSNNTGFVNVNK